MKILLTVLSVLFIIGCGSDVKEEAPKEEAKTEEKSE
tara:strand:- start:670 stop:780 length:111 start_codon:yes stop_codon:yes gene_type:complete